MKKLSALFVLFALVLSLSLTCFAEGETFVKAADFKGDAYGTQVFSGIGRMEDIGGYVGEIGSNLFNLAEGGNAFCVKTDSYVWFDFEAPSDGVYTFAFEYVARTGANRAMNIVIDPTDPTDDAEQTFIPLDPCDDNDDHRFCIFEATLFAGPHSFYFCDATGFDDSTIKSCDTYGFQVFLTEELDLTEDDEEEAAADAAEVAETAAEAPKTTAAATADLAVVAVVALIGSGVVLGKRR